MPSHLQITIDLELTAPVSGSIALAGEPAAPFSGWLELHAVLEDICACATTSRPSDE